MANELSSVGWVAACPTGVSGLSYGCSFVIVPSFMSKLLYLLFFQRLTGQHYALSLCCMKAVLHLIRKNCYVYTELQIVDLVLHLSDIKNEHCCIYISDNEWKLASIS